MSIKKVALVFAVFFCTNSYGGVYKCADANGHIAYSKTACNSKSDSQSIVDMPSAPKVPEKLPNDIALTESPSQTSEVITPPNNEVIQPPSSGNYKCDGRTYCSQMASCEEATFFIKNCPDTKMGGDMDGIPCERRWGGK
jgi:hypothetical protein